MKFNDMLNTITLGDSYNLIKYIPDKSIDLVYVDVPYLYNQGGSGTSELGQRIAKKRLELMGLKENHIKEIGKTMGETLKIAKKQKNTNAVSIENGFDYKIFDELCRTMKKINIFIWCSKLQILDIMKYFIEQKKCYYELIVWCKTNPTPTTNNSWLTDIEYCLYFREQGVQLNSGYENKSKFYVSAINKKDKDKYKHPTIKPLEIVGKHILHTTQKNDIVLDCFSGSGTTAVACKQNNRQFIGFEIDPEYHQISIDRLNGMLANGQISFDTIL